MITEDIDERMDAMCNLSDGVFEMGRERGLEQGLAEGRAEGQAEGRTEERRNTLEKVAALVRAGSLSPNHAMETFQISEDELQKML